VLALLAGACGDDGGETADKPVRASGTVETGLAEAGEPVRGGRLVYGIEAETTNGFCLPEARLATSGNLIRTAIYDSLTTLNQDAEAKPYLARSVTHNDAFTTWTIALRPGVTFHDGSPLDAEVLRNNFLAYTGKYPGRFATLFPISLKNVDKVTIVDDLTVQLTTRSPWPALPVFLTTMGIVGQVQLDDRDCASNMVGTGPFQLSRWTKNQKLVAQRNPRYWQIAPDGQPYPYADAIEFRPLPDGQQRLNLLDSGELNVIASSTTSDIHGPMTDLLEDGRINMLVSDDHAEVNYILMNASKPPFNDERMRRAVATGIDRDELNDLSNNGLSIVADQPFPEGDMGYVEDPGFPSFDPRAARRLVDEYVADGNRAEFTLSSSLDPNQLARAEIIKNMLAEVGIEVRIRTVEQGTLINENLAGEYHGALWRQHAGGDGDSNYIWWHEGHPTNFSRIDDPEINRALDEGRVQTDPAVRNEIYQSISRRFAEKVWSVWLSYSEWGIGLSKDVHGVFSAPLPDGGGSVYTGLAAGHPVHGMWVTTSN
jgi:peptide/nickel transport system substrate-binding protein